MRNVMELFSRLVALVPHLPDELLMAVTGTTDPRQLAYLVATSMRMEMADAQEILELDQVTDKLRRLTGILTRELEVLELGKKIQTEAQSEMEKVQREYFLREQLKAIQQELGEEDEQQVEVEEFAQEDRRGRHARGGGERGAARTGAGWPNCPGRRRVRRHPHLPGLADRAALAGHHRGHLDIAHARQVLDEDHYDLEQIKERILEFLAVRKLRQERAARASRPAASTPSAEHPDLIRREREGVILCFVGPPGVGKTSWASPLPAPWGASSSACPGRRARRGRDPRPPAHLHRRDARPHHPGDPTRRARATRYSCWTRWTRSARDFVATLLGPAGGAGPGAEPRVPRPLPGCAVRLSQVMFITTANVLDTDPGPLRDRMEILQLSGYTEEEKLHIAQRYLIPRQIKENGLRPARSLSPRGAARIIREYTREAACATWNARSARSAARWHQGRRGQAPRRSVSRAADRGLPRQAAFFYEVAERTQIPGVATGLAVTAAGGDILFIEATKMRAERAHPHRPIGRRDAGIGAGGAELRAFQGQALGHRRGFLQTRTSTCTSRPAPSQGWAFGRRDDGHGAGLAAEGTPGAGRCGDDRRDHPAWPGLPVGGIKEKVLAAHRGAYGRSSAPAQ